ncbi:MAG: hypothetical protein AMXMBFR33_61220 [Candidatus Xenobia bacterium]|jgi:Arc/MetJ-type ribon-helix-helix transcriptional regulator
MPQLNLQLTPEFEDKLRRFMQARRIKTKSEAIRVAVEESLERSCEAFRFDWAQLRGRGLGVNPSPRFQCDDDLWSDV